MEAAELQMIADQSREAGMKALADGYDRTAAAHFDACDVFAREASLSRIRDGKGT